MNATAAVAARMVAIAIAVAAVIDHAITTARRTRPVISVVEATGSRDSADARAVRGRLAGGFTELDAPFSGAEAHVVVGRTLSREMEGRGAPVFVVLPDPGSRVHIERASAPARAAVGSRVPVSIVVSQGEGDQVEVILRSDGATVDMAVLPAGRIDTTLWFVPPATGAARSENDLLALTEEGMAHADTIGPWLASQSVIARMSSYEAA